MKSSKLILSIVCSSMLLAEGELALNDSHIYTLEELQNIRVSEIATGTPLQEKFSPAITSIITQEDIQKSGARTLHEALEQVPGLHVYPSSDYVLKPNISIRGIQTVVNSQILIMIDGVALTTTNTGTPLIKWMMPTSLIYRIEVIRGPGSALYGADAFSGVINVITKKESTIEDEVGARYGSFNTSESWVNTRTQVGETKIGLSLSLMQSDGDRGRTIESDAQTTLDNIYGTNLSNAPGAIDNRYDVLSLHADVAYKDVAVNIYAQKSDDRGVGDGASSALDPQGYIDRTTLLSDIAYTNKTLFKDTLIKTGVSLSISKINVSYNLYPEGVQLAATLVLPNGFKIKNEVNDNSYRAYINTIYRGIDNHTLSVGVGYKYEAFSATQVANFGAGATIGEMTEIGDANRFIPNNDRSSYSFFIQDEYRVGNTVSLTSGFRYDNYSDFGSTINPRLALVWQASNRITLKTMYARAFRAPNFGDLYFNIAPAKVGNANIKPETIDTYEMALSYEGSIQVKTNIFYYQAKELIEYTSGVASNARNQNGYGLELELAYRVSKELELSGNYAYQNSEDAETKQRTANAPVNQGFAQVEYRPFSEWIINTQYFYIGKRYRTQSDTRAPLEADSSVNLTVEKENIFYKGLDFTISARNLFDADLREASNSRIPNDYPLRGRYIFGELKYRF